MSPFLVLLEIRMTEVVVTLVLLLVPWSAWTVGASHGLSPFGSVFGH